MNKFFWLKKSAINIAVAITLGLPIIIISAVFCETKLPYISLDAILNTDLVTMSNDGSSITKSIVSLPIVSWLKHKSGFGNTIIFVVATCTIFLIAKLGLKAFVWVFEGIGEVLKFIAKTPVYLWNWFFGGNFRSAFWTWTKKYYHFLSRYAKRKQIGYILLTHMDSLAHALLPRFIPTQGKGYHEFLTPYELRAIMRECNKGVRDIFGSDDHYVMDLFRTNDELRFSINKGSKTFAELETKIAKNPKEFFVHLSKLQKHGLTTTESDGKLNVTIRTRPSWKIQSMSPEKLEGVVKNGELLLGFTMKPDDIIEPFSFEIKKLTMGCFSAVTQAGKDNLVLGMNTSLLWQMKNGLDCELYFFDVKDSDGAYLQDLEWMGVHRIRKDAKEVIRALAGLVVDMEARLASFGVLGNFETWNRKHPTKDKKYSYKIIIINELTDLLSASEPSERKEIIKLLGSLLMRSLGAGFKCFIMTQTIRKDQADGFGKLLANMSTRFVGKSSNDDEARISLTNSYFEEYKNIERYNFVMIRDGELIEEFRPFAYSQEEVSEWITEKIGRKQLEIDKERLLIPSEHSEPDQLLPETKSEYLSKVDMSGLLSQAFQMQKLPRSLAMEFLVPEKKHPEFKKRLEGLGILLEAQNGVASSVSPNITLEEALQRISENQ